MHTWTLRRDSKLIRYYRFIYLEKGEVVTNLTFCKLFWGVVFSPVVLLLLGIFFTGVGIVKGVRAVSPERTPRPKKVKTPKEKVAKVPERASSFFDRISAFLQRHPHFVTFVSIVLWTVLIGIIVAALSFGGYEAVRHIHGFLHILPTVAIVLGAVAGASALFTAVIFVSISDPGERLERWVGRKIRVFLCLIGRGFRFVYQFFETGHHAVKYRTCPLIRIED